MTTINSVLGTLDTAKLGSTLMHEHLVGTLTGIFPNYPELLGERLMERIVDGLTQAKNEGIDTIVDASLFDNGREPNLMAEASRRSGVNIIATSGWYHEPADYPVTVHTSHEQQIKGIIVNMGLVPTSTATVAISPGCLDFNFQCADQEIV